MGIATEDLRADYGPVQAARAVGIRPREWNRLVKGGFLLGPDINGRRWSRHRFLSAAYDVKYLCDLEGWPIGALKASLRLEARLGRPRGAIDPDVISYLVDAGVLTVADTYKSHDLYDRGDLDALTADDVKQALKSREDWLASSVTERDAYAMLEWTYTEFIQVASQRGLKPGRDKRWSREVIAVLAEDEDLADTIRTGRTLGPDQSAEYLDIRRSDFNALTDAGLVKPATHVYRDVGRRSRVKVPLYRISDLEDARDSHGIDWEAVRDTPKGRPSPLRALAPKRDRPSEVRHFAAEMAEAYGVETWIRYRHGGARWEIDWTDHDGSPTVQEIRAYLASKNRVLAEDDDVYIESEPGRVARWARAMLRDDAAVILDTETNGLYGSVVQIAVIDAATGEKLINSLVNPGDVHWSHEAQAIHGISQAAVASAPTWADLHNQVMEAIGERPIIAYNVGYDRPVIAAEAARHHLTLGEVGKNQRWDCAMEAYSDYCETSAWLPLDGAHDALEDCRAVRELLIQMSRPPWADEDGSTFHPTGQTPAPKARPLWIFASTPPASKNSTPQKKPYAESLTSPECREIIPHAEQEIPRYAATSPLPAAATIQRDTPGKEGTHERPRRARRIRSHTRQR